MTQNNNGWMVFRTLNGAPIVINADNITMMYPNPDGDQVTVIHLVDGSELYCGEYLMTLINAPAAHNIMWEVAKKGSTNH